jgi:two-component system chemotaxis sensor kinase CheA
MTGELDEIQTMFFEECAEGLDLAEQGLSMMLAGNVSKEVIANVFRAVHSIKGGSGAFGHAALLGFSHCFENVLDEVRGGQIAATPEVTRIMLGAFDVLADHVAAARGRADVPDDGPAMAALDRLLETKGVAVAVVAPVEDSADEFGFSPVAVALEMFDEVLLDPTPAPTPTAKGDWSVRFKPSRAALANGAEPELLIREVERIGGRVVGVETDGLPGLHDIDPEDGYVLWIMTVPGDVERDVIAECFDFVAPDSLIEIVEVSAPTPVCAPAVPAPTAAPDAAAANLASAPARAASLADGHASDTAAQSIRVDLSKLDMLLNLVGELVIRGSILSDRLAPVDQERVELPELARLTREIQHTVMSLRAQPIRQSSSRFRGNRPRSTRASSRRSATR